MLEVSSFCPNHMTKCGVTTRSSTLQEHRFHSQPRHQTQACTLGKTLNKSRFGAYLKCGNHDSSFWICARIRSRRVAATAWTGQRLDHCAQQRRTDRLHNVSHGSSLGWRRAALQICRSSPALPANRPCATARSPRPCVQECSARR